MDLLSAIRNFHKIVEMGSFSRTARSLGVLPSSITRQVDSLEKELGLKLLQRSTRKVILTEAGRLYLERTADILSAIDEANQEILQLGSSPQGLLRIGLPNAFGHSHIVPLLPRFLTLYPRIKMEVTFSDDFVDLAKEEIDLAIRIGPVEEDNLIARKLFVQRRWLCASPEYLKARGTPETLKDLKRHDCLVFRYHQGNNHWYFLKNQKLEQIKISGPISTDSGDSLLRLALAGCGIALLPDWMIGSSILNKKLVTLLPEYEATISTSDETVVYVVYPQHRRASRKVEAFLHFLQKDGLEVLKQSLSR